MTKVFCTTLPIRIQSEANLSEHRMKKYTRLKKQKGIVQLVLKTCGIQLPCKVRLTRISPRELDEHDNLRSALKHIVDAIADVLIPGLKAGRADGDKSIKWEYGQKKGFPKEFALEIYLEEQSI